MRRVNNKASDSSTTTPRSLSVNQAYTASLGPHNMNVANNSTSYGLLYPPVAQSPTGDPTVSISSFYSQDRVRSGPILFGLTRGVRLYDF